MKPLETAQDDRKAQRRQQFLNRLRDERLLGAKAEPRPREGEKSQLARRREEPAQESSRALLRGEQRRAQQSESAQTRRDQELRAAELRKQQSQQEAELHAAKLRSEQRRTQQSGAAQARREQELQAADLRKQQAQQEAELHAAKVRTEQRRAQQSEAAQARREQELQAADLRKQQAQQEAEMRAAKPRAEQRRAQQSGAAQARREQELQAADLRKQQAQQEAELHAAKVRTEQRRAQQSEAAKARREQELQAAEQRKQQAQQEAEMRAAKLRAEQRQAQQGEAAQVRREQELRAAEQRKQPETQLLSGREQAVAAAQVAEKQRQKQQHEEALRVQAEAKRATARIALPSKPQPEAVARAPQRQARRSRLAPSRVRMALTTPAPTRMRTALAASAEAATEQPSDQFLYLRTSANLLVDENGAPVSLRGVTVRGFDTVAATSDQTFPAALTLDDSNLLEMRDRWGVNLVRLPFQAQTILSGNGSVSAAAMLAGLDDTVAAITEAGAYVLLALEAPTGVATPAPDASTIQAWQALASRYQAEPRALYEIFASPSPLAANWLQSAATLVATVRQQNPASVIFLGSGHGGVDVTGLPLRSQSGDPVPNIVYAIAVSTKSLPDPDDGQFRALAESYPLFVSMWSDDGSDFERLSARVADLFERFGIGWAASNWNTDPRLVGDAANHDFTPTGWGLIAQRALALSAVTAFKPSSAASESIFTARGPHLAHLKTFGSFIVDENNDPVNLRGVTVRGLDTAAPVSDQTFPAALALDDSNLLEMRDRWGVNLVRLPFQSATILSGHGSVSAAAMLAGLDDTVTAITEAGAYVLLALEAPPGNGAPAAPDIRAVQVWQVLAERYKENPGVLCEIFSSLSPLSANWHQAAATLVATIRQRKPASLIFLGSGNGGADVSGLPLLSPTRDPVFNLVYTIAVSPENTPNLDDGKLQALTESNPVFASVWSDGGSDFGRSSARIPDLFDRYGIGWAASSWNADPRLVADAAAHDFTSTGWGLIAGRAFRLPGRILLKPFGSDNDPQ